MGSTATPLTADRAAHLLYPDVKPAEFPRTGVNGGHYEPELRRLEKVTPGLHFEETLPPKAIGSATMRAFEQWLHPRAPPVPAGEEWGAKPGNPDWIRAMDPLTGGVLYKTTVDNVAVLMDEGMAAFNQWVSTAAPTPGGSNIGWMGVSPSGVQFAGRVNWDSPTGRWKVTTLYPLP